MRPDEPDYDRMAREIAELRDLFQRRLLNDRLQKQLFDELYRQLELADESRVHQVLEPVLRQLILVIDRIETIGHSAGCPDVIESVHHELTELLARQGVSRMYVLGAMFDPRVHLAVNTVATVDATADGTVVREFRAGYARGERVLRPAEVAIAKADLPVANP